MKIKGVGSGWLVASGGLLLVAITKLRVTRTSKQRDVFWSQNRGFRPTANW